MAITVAAVPTAPPLDHDPTPRPSPAPPTRRRWGKARMTLKAVVSRFLSDS
jgi:hypothetical protein